MINRTKITLFTAICLLLCTSLPVHSFSQVVPSAKNVSISYQDYLKMVLDNNLDYASEKYNVNIADAKIEAAKIFKDPVLSFDWSGDKELNSYTTEISKTFELGQKRKARINLARSESSLANSILNDYLRNLLADATLDYLAALKQNYLYEGMLSSFQMMKELSQADSIRLSLGSIKAIDAIQSKLEAGMFYNELLKIESERENSFINLSTKTSLYLKDTLLTPVGSFEKLEKFFGLNDLLITALNNRADLMAAENNIKYAQNLLKLRKRERWVDIDLKLGAGNSYLKTGPHTASSSEIYAGIAIPLKFSNFNKGEITIVKYQVEQGKLLYKQAEIRIQNEVLQAYNQYVSLLKQVNNYNRGLMSNAKDVLIGKAYSYSRGETSLLDVLNSQRTYNDLQTSYYETLHDCFAALVELERAVGIWDIDL